MFCSHLGALVIVPQLLGFGGRTPSAVPASTVDDDGYVRTQDGSVYKAEQATVPTTLLESTGRNREQQHVVKFQAAVPLRGSC